MHRKVLALLVVALLSFGAPTTALAQDNSAVAVNTKDGSSIFRFAFQIVRVTGEVVDQSNAAVAFASCESCQTVAVAIQIVLVFSEPSVVTPENIALAINEGCNLCETLASAVQFVLGTGGPVHFTPEGLRAIAEVRKQFHELRKSDLPIEEIQARVDELTAELGEILAAELVSNGPEDEPTDEPTATPTPEPSGSETSTESPTPEPTATPTPEPSSEPTTESSPEPSPSPTP